jgi:hypothetical protein
LGSLMKKFRKNIVRIDGGKMGAFSPGSFSTLFEKGRCRLQHRF